MRVTEFEELKPIIVEVFVLDENPHSSNGDEFSNSVSGAVVHKWIFTVPNNLVRCTTHHATVASSMVDMEVPPIPSMLQLVAPMPSGLTMSEVMHMSCVLPADCQYGATPLPDEFIFSDIVKLSSIDPDQAFTKVDSPEQSYNPSTVASMTIPKLGLVLYDKNGSISL